MDIRGFGYLVEQSAAGTKYWLTFPLADGWIAAYRVTYHGDGPRRRARIGELRIVPGRTGRNANFSSRQDYALYERHEAEAGRTIPPFSFEAVRRKVTPRFFADALASLGTWLPERDDPEAWGPPAMHLDSAAPTRRAPGRPGRDPRFYAKFAVDYHLVEHGERRERGASTRAILARKYKVPITTIGKWIRIARHHKFLTPVRSGQRGGMATMRARELSARSHK